MIRVSRLKQELFEERIDTVISKLKSDLDFATAPRVGRLKSYSNLDSRMVSNAMVFEIMTLTP